MDKLMNSIKSKIILMVVIVISCGFTAFDVYNYIVLKTEALQELEELSNRKVNRLAENLSLPLWEIDEGWTEKIISTEMSDKHVYAVFVYAGGELFAAKKRDALWRVIHSANDIKGDYIVRSNIIKRSGETIGSVKIYISQQFVLKKLNESLLREFMVLALLAVLIVIALVTFLNKLVIQRLQHILQAAKAIATGDYSHSIKTSIHDEVGLLSDGINSMRLKIKEREEALTESENRFRSLVDSAVDAFLLIDREGKIVDVNKAACDTYGYSIEEFLQLSVSEINIHFTREDLIEVFSEIDQNRTITIEREQKRKDGSLFPVEVRIGRAEQHGETYAIELVRDISERKKAEEKVRRFSQAMEQSGEAIVITNAEGVIEHINPAFTLISGYSEDEAIGENASILKSDSQDDSFYQNIWHTIAYGQTWQGKITNKRKNGELYPALLTVSPIKNDEGKTTHYVGVQQNLEKHEKMEAQFHQAQKMEAVGTLVGGIAHDFNNTLAGITGNLYLAKEESKDNHETLEYLENIENLSFRAADMIQQLLSFSRKGVVNMQPMIISSFLKEVIRIQSVAIPENINLYHSIETGDMKIMGDINQLQQVIMNLMNNARDAVDGAKKPEIRLQLEKYVADSQFRKSYPKIECDEFACISVTDNGSGIREADLEHIFEPFFTTKGVGEGTGLGLAMAYGAVQSHGGVITVDSVPGKGTAFRLYLPLLKNSKSQVNSRVDKKVVHGHGETILLVDDNHDIIEAGQSVLENLGYKVLTAVNGLNAVEVYQAQGNSIDLIILDMVMPEMGGPEAARKIRKINKDAKVIFLTGYDSEQQLNTAASISDKILSKPFKVNEFSQEIKATLDSA